MDKKVSLQSVKEAIAAELASEKALAFTGGDNLSVIVYIVNTILGKEQNIELAEDGGAKEFIATLNFDEIKKEFEEQVATIEADEDGNVVQKKENAWADEYRDKTTGNAIGAILRLLGKNSEGLTPSQTASDARQEEQMKLFYKISQKCLQICAEHDVPMKDMLMVYDAIGNMLKALKSMAEQELQGHQMEIMSRLIGRRHPNTELFSFDYANYKEFLGALEKVRLETGNNRDDYFFPKDKAKEEGGIPMVDGESVEETVPETKVAEVAEEKAAEQEMVASEYSVDTDKPVDEEKTAE
jgi:hypothetical protein